MLNLLQSTMLYHTPQPPDELNCYVFGKNSQQDASVALAKKHHHHYGKDALTTIINLN